MVFLINSNNRKYCSIAEIKIYEKDINHIIVYDYMIKYFGLKKSKDDIINYNTHKKWYVLRNTINYFCKEEDDGFNTTIVKKCIRRDFIIKSII